MNQRLVGGSHLRGRVLRGDA